MGTAVAEWLRCCDTNWKVDGSIAAGVTGNFIDISPSDRTMTLGLTQPLIEINTGEFPGCKGRRCVRLTTLLASCVVVMKSWIFNFLEPPGPLQAFNGTDLPNVHTYTHIYIFQYSDISWNDLLWQKAVSSLERELMDIVNMNRGNCEVLWKESNWTVRYTANGLLCYVYVYVIWVTNLLVTSFSFSAFNCCSRLQLDQNR